LVVISREQFQHHDPGLRVDALNGRQSPPEPSGMNAFVR
jgi:hypothetical protein